MSQYRKTLPKTTELSYIDILKKSKQREIDAELNEFKKKEKQKKLEVILKDFQLNHRYHYDE